ncbi:hypothetical protein CVIRNUC_008132 [Coccomyxa viridis]|uniref:Peroxisomal ATPase PEX1 n=1 Tax=Coccomyxa viridis TaxID=1274662 RepID=A0AAV1IDZ3_9CHLO|nr:hypothetical protein CVIRNUC_008132 [Coccomyxa viridis]
MEFLDNFVTQQESRRHSHLEIRLIPEKSCWVALPPAYVARLLEGQSPIPLVLQLSSPSGPNGRRWYVAWSGAASTSKALEVPAALAACQGLSEGMTVRVHALPGTPLASQVSVEPASADDWEQAELNAEFMEEQLVNQVGVVCKGVPFPFWMLGQAVLTLRVVSAAPDDVVRLAPGAEVSIAPQPRVRPKAASNKAASIASADQPSLPPAWFRVQDPLPSADLSLEVPAGGGVPEPAGTLQSWDTVHARVPSVHAAAAGLCHGDVVQLQANLGSKASRLLARLVIDETVSPAHVLLSPPALRQLGLRPHRRLAVTLKAAQQPGSAPLSVVLHPVRELRPGVHRLVSAEVDLQGLGAPDLRSFFASWLACQAAAGAHSPGCSTPEAAQSASMPQEAGSGQGFRAAQMQSDAEKNGKSSQSSCVNMAVPVQSGSIVSVQSADGERTSSFFIELSWQAGEPKECQFMLQSAAAFLESSTSVQLGPALELPAVAQRDKSAWPDQARLSSSSTSGTQAATSPPSLSGFSRQWVEEYSAPALARLLPLLHHTSRCLLAALDGPAPGGLLVCGPPGSGKSGLVAAVAHALSQDTMCRTHVVWIRCGEIETETLGKAKAHLLPLLREALMCMPALVVLDDLHLLCPAPSQAPEAALSNIGSAALVAWLRDVLREYHARPDGRPALPVVVCGTAPTAADVAAPLRAPGLLDCMLTLRAPAAEDRAALLASALQAKAALFDPAALQGFARGLEGYDAADLRALVERTLHQALMRRLALQHPPAGPLHISLGDLEAANRGFEPASCWGVGRVQGGEGPGPRGWQDVGGLADVRDALQEAMELPTKYAALIARAPLRLRTGVLLYGPPGCGKTHVVSAAVAAAGLRFVSVKGPELLNKYIGASEAAVRDIFRRASAAAPCVLFFDEFDAIAPRRGHDSTGVTDRVVNQLLTELDGVEGLKGVIVVGATSRPDMLDAALLRPGRLDRLLYCGFPTGRERLQILTALTSRLELDAAVSLQQVANACEGFSGADLSALLSDAQLEAVHEVLAGARAADEAQGVPAITTRHLAAAAAKARPSIPAAERERLESIYRRFRGSRDPGFGGTPVSGKGKGKLATLA